MADKVVIDVVLNTDTVTKDISKLQNEVNKRLSAGGVKSSTLQKVEVQLKQNIKNALELKSALESTLKTKINTPVYDDLMKKANEAQAKLFKMRDDLIQGWKDTGASSLVGSKDALSDKAFENVIGSNVGKKLYEQLEQANNAMLKLEEKGKAFTIDYTQAEKLQNLLGISSDKISILLTRYDELYNKANNVNGATHNFASANSSVKNLSRSVRNLTSDMGRLNKSSSRTTTDLSKGFKRAFTNILKYGFGIRSLYFLFRRLRSIFTDVIQDMAKQLPEVNAQMSAFKTAVNGLKGSLGTAFQPILTMILPALTKLIQYLQAAMTTIGRFFAMLTGQSYIYTATAEQVDYAKSLEKTGGAAKKAKKELEGYLSPIDEINKYNAKKDEDSGGGAGSGIKYEKTPLESFDLSKLKKLKKLIDEIVASFKRGFKDGLGDWKSKIDDIKKNLESIKVSLSGIFSDPKVTGALRKYINSVAYLLGTLAGSTVSIGLTIAQNIVGGIAKYLDQNGELIRNRLTNIFTIRSDTLDQVSTFIQSITRIFDAFGGENGQTLTANIIGIFSNAFLSITELASRAGNDFVTLLTQPIIDNEEELKGSLDGTLGVFADVFGTIKQVVDDAGQSLNDFWALSVSPIIGVIQEKWSILVGHLVDWWNGFILPIIQEIGDVLKELWNVHIKPLVDKIVEAGRKVAILVQTVWTQIKPYYDKACEIITSLWTNFIKPTFSIMLQFIKTTLGAIVDTFSIAFDALNGLLDIFIDIFSGNWEGLWEDCKNTLKNIWNSILTLVENAINGLVDCLNVLNFETPDWAPDWVKSKFGDSFGFNVPHISIPKLAQGGVIPPNREFMAVLGDQKNGTNIETPLSTMVEAFNQALAQSGGGRTEIKFVLPSKKEVAQYVIEGGRVLQTSRGRNPFELA